MADNTKAKQPIDLLARQSIGECTTESIVDYVPETPDQRLDGKSVSKNVFNLSHQALTEHEISVLDKGLNFVPTPEKLDLERLGRDVNLNLRKYFKDNPTPAFAEKPAFKVPSTWTPPIRDVELEFYLREIEDKLLSINESSKSYPNLSRDEREALHSLMNEDEIVIKSADKGSAIVVWSKKLFNGSF